MFSLGNVHRAIQIPWPGKSNIEVKCSGEIKNKSENAGQTNKLTRTYRYW